MGPGGRLGLTGLRIGFAARGALAALESLAYGAELFRLEAGRHPLVQAFVARHSSIDTGAEWLIALGFVLALSATIQRELVATNEDLPRTQHELQGLVDRDPLTGLANRRAIPSILRGVYRSGATILFFDLDDFKEVNDAQGHQAGDEVLVRFARALREAFRPDDRVMRYAGDEFVVVAPGSGPDRSSPASTTCGSASGPSRGSRWASRRATPSSSPGGDPEAALHAADGALYAHKSAGSRGRPGVPSPVGAES